MDVFAFSTSQQFSWYLKLSVRMTWCAYGPLQSERLPIRSEMWDNTIFNLQFSVQLPSIVVTVKWTGAMDMVQLGSEQVTREGDLVSTDGP